MKTSVEKNIELFNKKNAISTDFKLDYMTRLFRKISHKRFECYVIQCIWHTLNDDRVKFIVQQYIRRDKKEVDKYALADLYLPQLGIVVEVNEAYHYSSERQKKIDTLRKDEISKTVGVTTVEVVDCTKSLEHIHNQINSIVDLIKLRIIEKELSGFFKPWGGEDTLSVEYHKKKGYVKVEDDEYVRTIDDICAIFGTNAKHRGFLRVGVAELQNNSEYILWFPSVKNSRGWENELIDELTIKESNKDITKNEKHFNKIIIGYNDLVLKKRVTFLREKDDLGFNFYRFVGIFELDYDNSISQKCTIWKRVSDIFVFAPERL